MNKCVSAAEAVSAVKSGMTIGIGGWGRGESLWPWFANSCARTSMT